MVVLLYFKYFLNFFFFKWRQLNLVLKIFSNFHPLTLSYHTKPYHPFPSHTIPYHSIPYQTPHHCRLPPMDFQCHIKSRKVVILASYHGIGLEASYAGVWAILKDASRKLVVFNISWYCNTARAVKIAIPICNPKNYLESYFRISLIETQPKMR